MMILPNEIDRYTSSTFDNERALYANYAEVFRRLRGGIEPPQDVIPPNVRFVATKPYHPGDENKLPEAPKPTIRWLPGEKVGRGRIRYIARATAHVRRVSIANMVSMRRWNDLVQARWLFWSITKEITGNSYPAIGRALPGREFDHTTVLYGISRLNKAMCTNEGKELAQDRAEIMNLAVDDITKAGLRLPLEIVSLASSPDH